MGLIKDIEENIKIELSNSIDEQTYLIIEEHMRMFLYAHHMMLIDKFGYIDDNTEISNEQLEKIEKYISSDEYKHEKRIRELNIMTNLSIKMISMINVYTKSSDLTELLFQSKIAFESLDKELQTKELLDELLLKLKEKICQ